MTTANQNILSAHRLSIIVSIVFSLFFISCNKKDQTHKAETPLADQLSQSAQSTADNDSITTDTILHQEVNPNKPLLRRKGFNFHKETDEIIFNDTDRTVIIPIEHTGREIKATELESYNWKNMRLMLQDYESIFKENDYITGEQLAIFIHNKSTASNSVKKLTRWFITRNIDKIERSDKNLLIRTKDNKNIDQKLHIPGLVNVRLKINDKTTIALGNSFQSTIDPFNKRYMLPIDIDGIEIVNQGNQINLKGFVCGDLLYTNYPETTEGIPLRLK